MSDTETLDSAYESAVEDHTNVAHGWEKLKGKLDQMCSLQIKIWFYVQTKFDTNMCVHLKDEDTCRYMYTVIDTANMLFVPLNQRQVNTEGQQ